MTNSSFFIFFYMPTILKSTYNKTRYVADHLGGGCSKLKRGKFDFFLIKLNEFKGIFLLPRNEKKEILDLILGWGELYCLIGIFHLEIMNY